MRRFAGLATLAWALQGLASSVAELIRTVMRWAHGAVVANGIRRASSCLRTGRINS